MNKHKPLITAAALLSVVCLIACFSVGCGDEQKPSETTVPATATPSPTAAATTRPTRPVNHVEESFHIEPTTVMPNAHMIGVDVMLQDELESGCEIYSAVTLLHYYGFKIDEFDFIEKFLKTEPVYTDDEGKYIGPDMNCAFAGDPYMGYGAYAPAMQKAINLFLTQEKSTRRAEVDKSSTMKELCEKYIDKDNPVMVWVTTDMFMPDGYVEWIVGYTDENARYKEGDTFRWPTTEHCMLLIGYDDDNYYFADSLDATVVGYERESCEKVYKEMGSQAVYLK